MMIKKWNQQIQQKHIHMEQAKILFVKDNRLNITM